MRGMNSKSVDLIYLDPPFNSNHDYAAPLGSEAAGAGFKDTWGLNDIDLSWLNLLELKHPALARVISATDFKSDKAYLIYMAPRLLEMHRLLKPTGSIYLHCDPTMSHYLKLLMDSIFGRKNFRNEVIWRIGWVSGYKTQKVGWIRNHDTLLYYAMDKSNLTFNKEYIIYPNDYRRRDGTKPTGKGIPIEDTWNCSSGDILDSIMIKSFSNEKTGYPTQKPLALLNRIIKASSNKGDVVLDPFCGCATTCVAAEQLGRKWVGIDFSPIAMQLVQERLKKEIGPLIFKGVNRTDIPKRTDLGSSSHRIPKNAKKYLYGEQCGICAGCGLHFEHQHFEIDHIVAKAVGGTDVIENLQLLCGSCNKIKGKRGQEYLIARLQEFGYGKFRSIVATRAKK